VGNDTQRERVRQQLSIAFADRELEQDVNGVWVTHSERGMDAHCVGDADVELERERIVVCGDLALSNGERNRDALAGEAKRDRIR